MGIVASKPVTICLPVLPLTTNFDREIILTGPKGKTKGKEMKTYTIAICGLRTPDAWAVYYHVDESTINATRCDGYPVVILEATPEEQGVN